MRDNFLRISTTAAIALFVAFVPLRVVHAQPPSHPAAWLPLPLSHFTKSELQRAARLGAPEALRPTPSSHALFSTQPPTVLSTIENVDDNSPDSLLALVTSYSYAENKTIRRLVDLKTNTVVEEYVTVESSVPLAKVERAAVRSLVLRDPRITDLVGALKNDLTVEMLVTTTQDPTNRFFQKRIVLALLKTSRGYLTNLPKIFVNLSDTKVVLGE